MSENDEDEICMNEALKQESADRTSPKKYQKRAKIALACCCSMIVILLLFTAIFGAVMGLLYSRIKDSMSIDNFDFIDELTIFIAFRSS